MSKMSQLHAELSEQAYELGFESIEAAEQAGYGIDMINAKFIEPEEAAHQELMAEKKRILGGLNLVLQGYKFLPSDRRDIQRAIEFIEREVK